MPRKVFVVGVGMTKVSSFRPSFPHTSTSTQHLNACTTPAHSAQQHLAHTARCFCCCCCCFLFVFSASGRLASDGSKNFGPCHPTASLTLRVGCAALDLG